MNRRTFLGVSGGAAAAFIALHYIKWPDFDFLLSPEDIIEGVDKEDWIFTSCLNCPTRCAIKVRVINNERAVRIIGNSNSNYSDGKTCPRSHIGLQVLYNPKRIKNPLRRTNDKYEDPRWEEITWEDALTAIKNRLNGLSDLGKLLVIQGLNTTSDEDLIDRFTKAFGTTNLLREDRLEKEADREGKRIANLSDNTGYDLENANYILSFGADIIESEDPLSRNLRLWGKIRRERTNRARVIVIGSRYSLTASKADEWIKINPGTEGALAMAIANVIISQGLYDTDFVNDHTSGFSDYRNLVLSDDYSPDSISEVTGISAEIIRLLARDFASTKPAIAWNGAGAMSWPHGSYASHAIYCLNALVGSIDVKGGIVYQETPPYQDMPNISGDPGISLKEAADGLSDIDTVIGFNSNLIMSVPATSTWDEDLARVPFYVHIGPSWNEMMNYADIVLPACTYLEEWAYETALPGSVYAEVKIKQPVIEPLYESKPIAEIIFDLAGRLDTVKDKFMNIGDNPKGFVEYRTGGTLWNDLIAKGIWEGPVYKCGKYDKIFANDPRVFIFHSESLSKEKLVNIGFQGSNTDYPLVLTTYHPVLDIRNGNQNYPWAQEIFLVMHGFGWNNFVEMNNDDADERGIKDGDKVRVKSDFGEVVIKARVFGGITPGVVAIAMGQGHNSCGEWADGIGVNPNEVIGIDYDEKSGQASFRNTRVRIEKV